MADSLERRLTLDDGAETTVEEWGGTGPVMLCVHGMTSSRRSWSRLAGHYADRFRVVAYDQRGHGDSAAIHGPMALSRGVADLRNVARSLGAPVDVLVGHSWGGAVSILGAPLVDARCVVALDPMVRQAEDAWYDEYLAELTESFAVHGEERDRLTRADYAAWPPEDVDGKVHAVRTMSTAPIARLRGENPAGAWDLREPISRYDRPLLMLLGGDGGINAPETVAAVERAHGAGVDIRTFADQGHNLHRTALPAVLDAIDAFLAR